jgi:hypothetical protein
MWRLIDCPVHLYPILPFVQYTRMAIDLSGNSVRPPVRPDKFECQAFARVLHTLNICRKFKINWSVYREEENDGTWWKRLWEAAQIILS